MTAQNNFITEEVLVSMTKYLRLANYIGASQLYLQDNFLLEEELKKEHVKDRVLGHWGTVPGLNFIYANLNLLIKRHQQEMMLIVGPGHGYPALLANLFIEGSFGEYYPEYKFNKDSFGKLIKNFSWPGGFPSHANPETPGVILEGGELGYALATAFGAAMDNKDLIVACVVGDGEAETGPTATAWHSNKFLNPITSGAVLPIVHINKYKISGPTIYGTMSNEELTHLFKGYGYEPMIVDEEYLYEPMMQACEEAYQTIRKIQKEAREEGKIFKPKWPVILLKTKKGWTGPKELHGNMVEDSFRSHGIPLEHTKEEDEEFELLKNWLSSYKVQELLTDDFKPLPEIMDLVPKKELQMGMNKNSNGGSVMKPLKLPEIFAHEVKFDEPTKTTVSNMSVLGKYLEEVMRKNYDNFRIMSPDETESNKLHDLFNVTKRGYIWPTPPGSENIGPEGRVMEMLSEHTLQGWMQGYILTGRHSVFISYEAFMMIISSMVDQYAKFLKQKESVDWRKPLPSMNFILTSTTWRQDHNGFSHQNPGFISDGLNNHSNWVNIHFPADANMLVATMEECMQTTNKINIIVTGKRGLPQYMTMAQAKRQLALGMDRWEWAGNQDKDPDVVLAATGDYPTQEVMATLKILKEVAPELKTRFVSVTELTCFGIGDNRNSCRVSLSKFRELFTFDKEVIFNYHGYPEDIKQLIFQHPDSHRFKIHGYIEKGTTTTPFDMQVQNRASRYHLAMDAVKAAAKVNPIIRDQERKLLDYFEAILMKHKMFIKKTGTDIPEVADFIF